MRAFKAFIGRLRQAPEVTICIPTYQAEAFIKETLNFATGQTFERIRILVSVDFGNDSTADLCRSVAVRDARVTVFEQPVRLGWAGNVNFLLERVQTPYFFIYFHDDVILPQYVERLLDRLSARQDAASANCNVGQYGGAASVTIGRTYEGSTVMRLLQLLLAPERGAPLRSLTRSSALSRLRLPVDAPAGFLANEPYLMNLVAAGPAMHLDETLYIRWHQRAGGVVDRWASLDPEAMRAGFRSAVAHALAIIDRDVPAGNEGRAALIFALLLNVASQVRNFEQQRGIRLMERPEDLHPAFCDVEPPPLDMFGHEIATWGAARLDAFRHTEQAMARGGKL